METKEVIKVSEEFKVEPAALMAVKLVESGKGGGFLPSGNVTILFEGHIFYRELKKVLPLTRVLELQKQYPNIIFPKWDKKKYIGGEGEWPRLNQAIAIHKVAALKSASWGMFQIMGFNHNLCGCRDVVDFVKKMEKSEESQLKLTMYYLNNTGIIENLRNKDWKGFAKKYNGVGQVQYYSQKLENSYNTFKKTLG